MTNYILKRSVGKYINQPYEITVVSKIKSISERKELSELLIEMDEWCKENICEKNSCMGKWERLYWINIFSFTNENDALSFYITWNQGS